MKFFRKKINPLSRGELFELCVDFLIKICPKSKNKKKIIRALIKREKETTTNFGMGFAIPHCQSRYVKEPCLGFVSFENEIDYEDNNKKISFAIFIFLPKKLATDQIKILSGLTRQLIDPKIQKLFKALDKKVIEKFVNGL